MAGSRVEDVDRAGIGELLEALRLVGRNLEREARFVRQAVRSIERRLAVEQEAGASAGDTHRRPEEGDRHDHDPAASRDPVV